MKRAAQAIGLVATLALGACTSLDGNYPNKGSLLPDVRLALTPNTTIPTENLLFGAAGAALLYYIYDPLAPNWEIAEARLADDTYRLSMKMKRFHRGGDGEAMRVFRRRAAELQLKSGSADYRIVDFVEGVESTTPVAQRFSEGMIKLVGMPAVPPPATPAR